MQKQVTLWVVVISLGCGGGQKTEVVPKPEPAETADEQPDETTERDALDREMLGHWVKASKARDQLLVGDLAAAKTTAAELERDVASPPTAWTTYVTEMKLHATTLQNASSIDEASEATASIGATCGSCHANTNAGVQMANSQPPAIGDDSKTHMQRHQWAVNAMWEGLVGPSDGRWIDGLGVLAEKPLHGREEPSGHVTKDELELLGEKVHDLGVRGTGVPHEERAAIFAELVAACGNCHAKTLAAPE